MSVNEGFDFDGLVELCRRIHEQTQRSAARVVDRSLAVRNWLFGRYIVEYEQHGADRAEYGRGLIASLSYKLKAGEVKGCSPTNLRKFREFYLAYPQIQQTPSVESTEPTRNRQAISGNRGISETPSQNLATPLSGSLSTAQIPQTLSVTLAGQFTLGWSHYVTLLNIDIVLCGLKNDAVVELTLPEEANIYASKYQLYLPSKQELAAQLESIQRELNYRKGEDDE